MARPLRHTGVDLLVLHGALEEALAGLAGEQAVVVAAHLVATHGAKLLEQVLEVDHLAAVSRRGARAAHGIAGTGVATRSAIASASAAIAHGTGGHVAGIRVAIIATGAGRLGEQHVATAGGAAAGAAV